MGMTPHLVEGGDAPCSQCDNAPHCKERRTACGDFVTFVKGAANAKNWAKEDAGRHPSKAAYWSVFGRNA